MELKFNFAKITQSRLMGSMGMIIDKYRKICVNI